MKEFKDKVAVITGAASGIGRGLAERCAEEDMKIVLADIDQKGLFRASEEMKAEGAKVLAIPTDVSKADDIEALAQKTLDTFGSVHLLFNNAGVLEFTRIVESTQADWEWVMGVNLWGVIYGVRVFTPIMLNQNTNCHIINTASVAGLISGPSLGIYKVTKHAVVSLSETLYYELSQQKAKVKVSVLCPGFTNTRIVDSERNRPSDRLDDPSQRIIDEPTMQSMRQAIKAGMSAHEVAEHVFRAIKQEKLYILTDPEWKELVRTRMEDILLERNPTES